MVAATGTSDPIGTLFCDKLAHSEERCDEFNFARLGLHATALTYFFLTERRA